MRERRQHKRVSVDFWATLEHPLIGTVTGKVLDMSVSGLSMQLDEQMEITAMMDLDVRIRGDGWDESAESLPVQVVRAQGRDLALRFMDPCDDFWMPPEEEEIGLDQDDLDLLSISDADLSEPQ